MRFTILTLFPELLDGPLNGSIVGRARQRGIVEVGLAPIRPFGLGPHRQVDDAPYGGGPGMLLKADVLAAALDAALAGEGGTAPTQPLVVWLTPQGETFTQAVARELALHPHVVLVCGHYEGVDERFVQQRVDRELSLGDFVLTGGEIAALAVVDAVTRLLPGALGDPLSAQAESFQEGLLDHPHYTRPPRWEGWEVPPVLLSGNHGAVAAWRRKESLLRTLARRPDLLEGAELSRAERRVAQRLLAALAEEPDPPVVESGVERPDDIPSRRERRDGGE